VGGQEADYALEVDSQYMAWPFLKSVLAEGVNVL
jgi:hypothetical protein